MWDEEQLKIWLAGHLGGEVPEKLWQDLDDHDFIEQALRTEDGRNEVLGRVSDLREIFRDLEGRRAPPGRTIQISDLPDLPSGVEAWVDALSEFQAFVASRQPEVHEFRDNVLGGVLSPEKALEFVRTPRLARCSRDGMEAAEGHWEDLFFPSGKGKSRRRIIRQGSVLDELRSIGRELASKCLWRKSDAVWYVLTDIVPRFRPIRVSAMNYLLEGYPGAQVRMRVDVRVPARAVMRAYRKAQDEILEGRDNRLLSARNIRVFRFVMRQVREIGRRSWRVRMRDWNKEYPEWLYENSRNFHRDYYRAFEWLIRRFQFDAVSARIERTEKKSTNNTDAVNS
jgi:hypothetical protein